MNPILIANITTRCNLRCTHCLRGYPSIDIDLPTALFDILLGQAADYNVNHVGLTGGEPCLNPEFETILKLINRYRYTWHFVSNGFQKSKYIYLMDKYRKALKYVVLSIDGSDAEMHDSLRMKKGSFDNLCSTAMYYKKEGFPIHLLCTINNKNKNQVLNIINLAAEFKADSMIFAGTIPTQWNEKLTIKDHEAKRTYENILEHRQQANIDVQIPCSSLHTLGGIFFCNNLSLREISVNPFGEMTFCCDIHDRLGVVGNLYEQKLSVALLNWLEMSQSIQAYRTDCISKNEINSGFNNCSFCNSYFINNNC